MSLLLPTERRHAVNIAAPKVTLRRHQQNVDTCYVVQMILLRGYREKRSYQSSCCC